MEQLADVVARTGAFVEEIKALDGDVLISTHAIAMKGILEHLTPDSGGSYWSKYLGNCAVYAITVDGGQLGVPVELL
jgi:broad specificity phosphatase PhoE